MIDDFKRLIKRHGVSGVMHALSQALAEMGREIATAQPRSTAHEMATEYRYASRAVASVASAFATTPTGQASEL